MSRRSAAVVAAIAWLVALLAAPDKSARGLAVWALLAAVVVAGAVVVARVLSRELRRAVTKEEQ